MRADYCPVANEPCQSLCLMKGNGDCSMLKSGGLNKGAKQMNPVEFRKSITQELHDVVKEAIHTFNDRVTLAEVLGILEVIKFELIQEASE